MAVPLALVRPFKRNPAQMIVQVRLRYDISISTDKSVYLLSIRVSVCHDFLTTLLMIIASA